MSGSASSLMTHASNSSWYLNDRGIQHEVVILDAPDEEALRHTHGRYISRLSRSWWKILQRRSS